MSVSVTTRKPRPGEVDGQDYHFIDVAGVRAHGGERGELLEYAQVFGNSLRHAHGAGGDALAAGRDVLFDIDWQGAQQLKERHGARPRERVHPAARRRSWRSA